MRHRKHIFKIGRRSDHVRSLLANQVCSLIVEEQIETTVTKAKETRRLAEKMVTLGKKGTLHHRRQAISKLRDKNAVAKLFSDVAPRYIDRVGGYTQIIRLGKRVGDAADMCLLRWIDESTTSTKKKSSEKSDKEAEEVTDDTEEAEEVTDDTEEAEEVTDDTEEAEEVTDDTEEAADTDEDKEEDKKKEAE